MKLFYNKNSKDPIYYAQIGIRNGKKVTTRNVKRFGKHSELLEITDDPLSYVKEEIRKMNEEYRVGKVEYTISTNYNERVEQTDDEASSSTGLNIGYIGCRTDPGAFSDLLYRTACIQTFRSPA